MNQEFSGTLTRVHYWERVFRRLRDVFAQLESRSDSFLAVSFAFLLERSLGDLRLPASEEVAEPLEAGAEADRFGSALRWIGRASHDREEEHDSLQVLLRAAESVLADSAQYDFADLDLDEDQLLREFVLLASFTDEGLEEVQLLPPKFLRFWLGMIEVLRRLDGEAARHRLQLSLLRVIRGVYALAVGFDRLGRGTDELRQDLLLAYSLGESAVQQALLSRG